MKTKVMGILNATPDSFYAPSRYDLSILDSGADIIDIGACSTRPGSLPVGAKEEWKRMLSVLPAVKECGVKEISIDTYWADVAERACDYLGRPVVVNDVSAGEADPMMLPMVARLGLEYVAMCRDNDPMAFFKRFEVAAEVAGIKQWILDPGFGFGKTMEENWEILHSLDSLKCFGRQILVGISRKRMIYLKNNTTPMSPETLAGTLAAQSEAVSRGASIIRTHDVSATRSSIFLHKG